MRVSVCVYMCVHVCMCVCVCHCASLLCISSNGEGDLCARLYSNYYFLEVVSNDKCILIVRKSKLV